MKTHILILVVGLFSVLMLPNSAFSQTVKTVKGQKVLLELQGMAAEVDQEFFAIDASGKKRAILKIKQVKNDKAVADITKGKAEAGYTVQARKKAGTSGSDGTTVHNKGSWGVLGSYAMDKMDASFTAGTPAVDYSAAMQGTGFGALGFYEMPVNKELTLRASAGLEQFIASTSMATAVCDNLSSTTCNVSILYISFYGAARYNIVSGKAKVWVAGGLGYLFAATKSSTVLRTDALSTYVIVPSFGVDIPMGKNFIPIALDYSLFPDSATVKASSISLRAGYGWYF